MSAYETDCGFRACIMSSPRSSVIDGRTLLFSICSSLATDYCQVNGERRWRAVVSAEWRFPSAKQQRAEDTARRLAEAQRQRDQVSDHDAWWAAVLADPRASTPRPSPARRLAEIRADLLRVE